MASPPGAFGNDQTDTLVLAKFSTPEIIAKVSELMDKTVASINPTSYRSQVVNGTNYKVKAIVMVGGRNIPALIEAYEPPSGPIEIKGVAEENVMVQPGSNMRVQEDSTPSSKYNTDLANRQLQVNEWSYNNKMDTLFVFQILFISLLFVGLLLILKGQGLVNGGFVWYSMSVTLVIVIVIIINRSVYTNSRRDNRFWNKKRFQEDNMRESPLTRGFASYQKYIDSVRSAYGAPAASCRCPTPPANC
jgi:hypothetical protein